jgi:PPOX class probable F420-dependent enzyme
VTTLGELASASYVLLTTYRKDGRAVPTPVWVVPFEGGLGVWTIGTFGKTGRIRHTPRVTVAICDMRGNSAGPAVEGTAAVLDAAGTEGVCGQIRRKYGLYGRITLWGSRVRRGREASVGIKIMITGPSAA